MPAEKIPAPIYLRSRSVNAQVVKFNFFIDKMPGR